jgi:FkbM family methyltransferase
MKARFVSQRLELIALTDSVKPDEYVIDVGANKGSYLWSLSRAVPQGRVFAFEPQPILAKYLTHVCQEAGLDNVQIENKGISDVFGILKLAIPGRGTSSPGASFEQIVASREVCRTIDVNVSTLDDYFQIASKRIGAIKIDVEGHELKVLNGAIEIIKKFRPTVVCESEQRHISQGSVNDIFEFFNRLNYEGYFCAKGSLLSVDCFDPKIHQKEGEGDYWNAKDYFNNFVFRPR